MHHFDCESAQHEIFTSQFVASAGDMVGPQMRLPLVPRSRPRDAHLSKAYYFSSTVSSPRAVSLPAATGTNSLPPKKAVNCAHLPGAPSAVST